MMRSVAAALLVLTAALQAEMPRPSPEYAIAMPNGQQDLLSKYRGKVVVLEFLFTTCPHCQHSAGVLSKLQTELGPKGFQALGVAINADPNVPDFVRRYNVNFPVGSGTRDSAYAFLEKSVMSPFSVPQIVIIDKAGMIRGQYSGSDPFLSSGDEVNLRNTIQKLQAEPTAKSGGAKTRKKAS